MPIQQARSFVVKLRAAGEPAELVVKPGAQHGWADVWTVDMNAIADWFDKHL